jgi:hypothetical protein
MKMYGEVDLSIYAFLNNNPQENVPTATGPTTMYEHNNLMPINQR